MKILLVIILVSLAFPLLAAERAIKRQTLSSPSPVETPYLSGKYRALVIGNNDYDDPEKLWPSLKTAVADAEAVADILKTDYGFAEITLLKNAKQREIVRAFNKLAKSAQENDSVLIYYAGHGYLNEETKEGFWIPVDAEGRDDSTFVSNAIIKTKLGVIADKAKHVLLVSDSCFSGALLREGNRGVSLDQKNERYYQKVAKKKSVQILAAGGLEFVDDNYKGTGHSPFTYYLLQSLKDNNARYFEATDLSQETSRNVSVNTMQTPESGVLQGAGHAGGEFFFLRQKTVSATASAAETEKSVSASASVSKPVASAPRKFRADEETWELVKESNDPDDFIFFLDEFPESPLSSVARLKLRKLKKAQKKLAAKQKPASSSQSAIISPSKPKNSVESSSPQNKFSIKEGFEKCNGRSFCLRKVANSHSISIFNLKRMATNYDWKGAEKEKPERQSTSKTTSRTSIRQTYDKAVKQNSIFGFRNFIKEYKHEPKAKYYLSLVKKKLKKLEGASETTTTSSSEASSGYTKRQAYLDFLKAKVSNTKTALQNFLRKHADTPDAERYRELARKLLKNF